MMIRLDGKRWYTLSDASRILGLSEVTVDQYARRGRLQCTQIGRLIPEDEIKRYKRERKAPGRPKSSH